DGQRCGAIVADANADRCFPVAGQIGLSKGRATGGEPFPSVASHEEFSLNLETHSPPSTGLGLHTCGLGMATGKWTVTVSGRSKGLEYQKKKAKASGGCQDHIRPAGLRIDGASDSCWRSA